MSSASIQVGEVVAHKYRIEGIIGEGAMGRVLLAHDPVLGREFDAPGGSKRLHRLDQGILHHVLVYRVESDSPVNALVNPEIEWSSKDKEYAEEGCLSLPAVHVEVERPVHVRVKAQDEQGEQILVEASGLEARVIQHEMDHLDGVLILDRTSRDQRKEGMRALRAALEAAEDDAA